MSRAAPAAPSGSPRLAWIDAAKGASILVVVVHHAYLFAHGTEYRWHAFRLTDIVLPLFFLTAGMTTSFGLNQKPVAYLVRRVLPIAWIYVVWTLLYGLFNEHVTAIFPWVNGGQTISLLQSVTWPWGNLWFVWILGSFCLVVWPLARLAGRAGTAVVAAAFALSIASDLGVLPWHRLPAIARPFLTYLPFFLAGAFCTRPLIALAGRPAAVALLGLISALSLAVLGMAGDLETACRTLRFAAGTGFGLALAVALPRTGVLMRSCEYCGTQSLAIYLGHQILLALGFLALAAGGAVAPAGWPMLLVLSALAVAGSLALRAGAVRMWLGWIYAPPAALIERLSPRPGRPAVLSNPAE